MDVDALRASVEEATVDTPVGDFDPRHFHTTGAGIVRGVFPSETIDPYVRDFHHWYSETGSSRTVESWNAVSTIGRLPERLASLHTEKALLDLVESVVGPEIGLAGEKFFLKDHRHPSDVFLHHDYPYGRGSANKVTAFVPLTPADAERGTLELFLGTHHFGYLGDAGEIDASLLPRNWPTAVPVVQPGDVVLMHCLLWHRSGPNRTRSPRAFVAPTFQPASDFATRAVVRGSTPWVSNFLNDDDSGSVFTRSRSSRLIELQAFYDSHQPKTVT